jgi:hypothetical protein
VPDTNQVLRLRIRERLDQYAIDNTEYRGVRADADHKRQQGNAGKRRRPDQSPENVPK